MNGAMSVVQTLLAAGVDTCFANPGTSEMHFVAALDQAPGMRCVLGLQENVVTGMADGYHRIAGKPPCTLLHCAPGLANGVANLHNAHRARSGVVNIVGDQATWHRPFDAPLTGDTIGIAQAVSSWTRTSTSTPDVGRDAAEAVRAASTHPGRIATLILPADVSWGDGGQVAAPLAALKPPPIDAAAIDTAARMLREDPRALILLGEGAVLEAGQVLAWRIASHTGATLMGAYVTGHVARVQGRLPLERVPYGMDAALKVLAPYRNILLVNTKPPVGFFGYPGKPSLQHDPNARLHVLSRDDQDPLEALEALADALGAPPVAMPAPAPRPEAASGTPTIDGVARTVAAVMPENAIVADESISYGRNFYPHSHGAPANDWLHMVGGAIGGGLPMATGAAIAAKSQRRVIGLQADGSAMYTLQALWTQARERLPVTTVLLNNGKYNILIGEYAGVGARPGETAMSMLDLGDPSLDWVKMANGMGVEAARATDMQTCADLMRGSFRRDGPFLIELMV